MNDKDIMLEEYRIGELIHSISNEELRELSIKKKALINAMDIDINSEEVEEQIREIYLENKNY